MLLRSMLRPAGILQCTVLAVLLQAVQPFEIPSCYHKTSHVLEKFKNASSSLPAYARWASEATSTVSAGSAGKTSRHPNQILADLLPWGALCAHCFPSVSAGTRTFQIQAAASNPCPW